MIVNIVISVWLVVLLVGSFLGAYAMATGTTPLRRRKRARTKAREIEEALNKLHAHERLNLEDLRQHQHGWHEFQGHYHWNSYCCICGWSLRFHAPTFIIDEDPVLQVLGGQP